MNLKYVAISSILITGIVFLTCCGNTSNRESKIVKRDTVVKDITEYRKTPQYTKLKKDIETKAGIGSISEGFDSLQLRIWFTSPWAPDTLVILKNSGSHWSGQLYTLQYVYDSSGQTLSAIQTTSKVATPKSGWKKLMDSLYTLNILTLPDMETIPGYNIGFDGYYVGVEVATASKYRMYTYFEPGSFQDSVWQARNIVRISGLLHRELDF